MKIDCPAWDITCPYFQNGSCRMSAMGDGDPLEECDAFFDYEDDVDECGFDPYLGCYTDDC